MTKQIIILLAFTLAACNYEEQKPRQYGEATALLNGQPWQAHAGAIETRFSVSGDTCANQKTLDIIINSVPPSGFDGKKLGINKIPQKVGTYLIYKKEPCYVNTLPGASFSTGADDILVDYWHVLESAYNEVPNNFVTITSIDTVKREVKGKFQITFLISPTFPKSKPSVPDTLRVTNGVFRCEYLNKRQL